MTKTSYAKESDKIVTWLEDVILQYKKITKKNDRTRNCYRTFLCLEFHMTIQQG